MFELRLLRRPLPPKAEPDRYIPKRKRTTEIHKKKKEAKEMLGDVDGQPLLPSKSHTIYLSFPDYETGEQVLSHLKRDVVIPVQLSGPPSFPMQKRRIPIRLKIPALREGSLKIPPDWTLHGVPFGGSSSPRSARQEPQQVKRFISSFNYEVFTSHLVAKEMRGPERVAGIFLKLAKPEFGKLPVPRPEKILEKSMLGERLKEERKRPVYEEVEQETDATVLLSSDAVSTPESSLLDKKNEMLAKAEMVVLYCIMHRQSELSLKGYFLSQIPDLSPLSDFLLYLNLSYNYLESIPPEVFHLKNLEVLKIRNNPIKCIPEEISMMTNLTFLSIAFNLLTTLPPELFALPNLQNLDISYNELEFIPNEIRNLRSLKYLNLEGNLLCSLPCGILKLQLSHLMLENNFLHPCFWNEVLLLQPQRLTDMAALCFVKHKLWKVYPDVPEAIQEILSNFSGCDCCDGPMYGNGFRFILIYRNVYGLRIPYQFSACSPACHRDYIQSAMPP